MDAICFWAVKISSIGGRIMLLRGKKYLFVTPYTSPFLRISKQALFHEKQQRKTSKTTKLLERFRSRHSGKGAAGPSATLQTTTTQNTPAQNTPLPSTPKDTNIDTLYPLEQFEHKMLKEEQEAGHCGVYELQKIPAFSLKNRSAQIRTKDSFVVYLPKAEDMVENAKRKSKPLCRCDVVKKRTLMHRDLMTTLLKRALVVSHPPRAAPLSAQTIATPFPSRKGKEPMLQQQQQKKQQRQSLTNFLDVVRDWETTTEEDPWKQIWSEEEIETMWANPWDSETAAWIPDQDPETQQEKSQRFDKIQFLRLQLVQIWNLVEPSTSTAEMTLETVLKQLRDRTPCVLPENPAEIARLCQQAEQGLQKRITALQAFLAKSRGRQRLLQAIVDMVTIMKRMRTIGGLSKGGGGANEEEAEEEEEAGNDQTAAREDDRSTTAGRTRTSEREDGSEHEEPQASTSSNPMARLQNPHQLQMVESELMMDKQQCKLVEEILSGMKTALEILGRANRCVSEMDLASLSAPQEEALKVDELDFSEEQYVVKSVAL